MGDHSAFDEPCTVHRRDRFAVTATNRTSAFQIEKEGSRVRPFEEMHAVQIFTVASRILMLARGAIIVCETERAKREWVYVLLIGVVAVTSIIGIKGREVHLHGGGSVRI